ncbi:hypothetical protein RV11_GL002260 [Enterococcus phoeniculicola]|nr:hypothetical protein RV11_GL002260 [Enterococcus phoeniculicola]
MLITFSNEEAFNRIEDTKTLVKFFDVTSNFSYLSNSDNLVLPTNTDNDDAFHLI